VSPTVAATPGSAPLTGSDEFGAVAEVPVGLSAVGAAPAGISRPLVPPIAGDHAAPAEGVRPGAGCVRAHPARGDGPAPSVDVPLEPSDTDE